MKSIKASAAVALIVILLLSLLTACAQHGPVTVYADDAISVTRAGRETRIVDTQSGGEYVFTTRRVKKAQDAAEAMQRMVMQIAADNSTIKIMIASDMIFVVEKTSGQYVLIKAK